MTLPWPSDPPPDHGTTSGGARIPWVNGATPGVDARRLRDATAERFKGAFRILSEADEPELADRANAEAADHPQRRGDVAMTVRPFRTFGSARYSVRQPALDQTRHGPAGSSNNSLFANHFFVSDWVQQFGKPGLRLLSRVQR